MSLLLRAQQLLHYQKLEKSIFKITRSPLCEEEYRHGEASAASYT